RRHTRFSRDWSSDVCSSDLLGPTRRPRLRRGAGGGHRSVVRPPGRGHHPLHHGGGVAVLPRRGGLRRLRARLGSGPAGARDRGLMPRLSVRDNDEIRGGRSRPLFYHQNRTRHSMPHRGGSLRRSSSPAWSVPPARGRRTLTARPLSAVTPTVAPPPRTMGTMILGTPTHSHGPQRPVP